MKKLLIFLVLVGCTSFTYSQTLIQTFTDRCTGATQVFQIAMTGTTTVVFYGRAQSFTAADVQSGAFQAWLQETYAWWAALNPCSAAQAEATTAQQTAQQTTQAATAAASSAASAAPPTPPDTSSTNTTSSAPPSTDNTASNSGTDSTSSSQSSDSSSSSTSESSQSETSDSSGGGESSEDTGGGETTESENESTEETSSEESNESESEEPSEESSEEESSEDEESSNESKEEDKKEEDKKKQKKRTLAPPILAANMMGNQMLDGTWTTAASFGISQSSLTGQETYSLNTMIWSDLKQFSLGLSKSKVHFWKDYEGITYLVNPITGKRTPARDPKTGKRYVDRQNQIHHVGSTSFNYMNIYGTSVLTAGYSHVILGQNDNFWKGFAGGYAATTSIIILPESTLFSPALTFFGTKPVAFKALPRWGFGPMVAVSLTPLQITNTKNEFDKNQAEFVWNEYFTYIIGTNVNFNLTQRFVANLGINTINNTNPIIPTTFAITIGARFAF